MNSHTERLSLNDLDTQAAKAQVIQWLEKEDRGRRTTNYKLRDWLFSRQRYWGEPFPVLHFEDGTKRLLEADELPLCPPQVTDYKPSGEGLSPLASVRSWVELFDEKSGKRAYRETNTMPQWAGSCWYYLRFTDPRNDEEAWSKRAEQYWMPVDLYIGGAEHAVLHLLYARFWHKVLYDCGLVSTLEPFQELRNQGMVTARSFQKAGGAYVSPDDVVERDGHFFHRETGEELRSQFEKMSKSKLNGVTPDEIIEEYGADALRLYEMFLGPLEKEKPWNTDAVSGMRRFLNRFFDMVYSDKVTDEENEEALRLGHRLVHQTKGEIEALQFNTAIAKMMEFLNAFTQLKTYPRTVLRQAVLCLSPFAPHIAEELWQVLGGDETIVNVPFPKAEERYLVDSTATYVVQINGKMRGFFELPKDQSQEVILEFAKGHAQIGKYITGDIKKVIFVPNKLINLVI